MTAQHQQAPQKPEKLEKLENLTLHYNQLPPTMTIADMDYVIKLWPRDMEIFDRESICYSFYYSEEEDDKIMCDEYPFTLEAPFESELSMDEQVHGYCAYSEVAEFDTSLPMKDHVRNLIIFFVSGYHHTIDREFQALVIECDYNIPHVETINAFYRDRFYTPDSLIQRIKNNTPLCLPSRIYGIISPTTIAFIHEQTQNIENEAKDEFMRFVMEGGIVNSDAPLPIIL